MTRRCRSVSSRTAPAEPTVASSVMTGPLRPVRPERSGRSLLIALHDTFGSHDDIVGVAARGPAGPSLAQQVPALVERDLDVAQPLDLGVGQPVAGMRALQAVLFVGQLPDAL